MHRYTVAKILSVLVGIVGLVSMIGWIWDVRVLQTLFSSSISMKFVTAFAFFLSGIKLYFITKFVEGKTDTAQVVLPITVLTVFLLMATLLTSVIIGEQSGIENLFVREDPGAVETIYPGSPALPTMIDFILIAIASIAVLVVGKRAAKALVGIGTIVVISGILPIVGYLLHIPVLYYSGFAGSTNPIAPRTAFLFVVCGLILVLTGTREKSPGTA